MGFNLGFKGLRYKRMKENKYARGEKDENLKELVTS